MSTEASFPDAQLAADPYLGRTIAGRYRLQALIGSGGAGVVYRAEHLGLGSLVAVKLPGAALVSDPAARARFRREARAAARLDHPNSVRVLDFGTEPGGLTYLVMELLEGRELLAPILEESPLPPERTVRILGQVLDALVAAHEAGIVHRDLKPENILLVEQAGGEVAKIADFGIAKPFGGSFQQSAALSATGMLNGTPTYMAPEQIMGEELDGRADLYAVGAILYEMLCGTPPFLDPKPFDLLLAHLMRVPSPPSERRGGVHAGLEAVALRAMAKKREDRYPDARAMGAALRAALEQPAGAPADRTEDEVDDEGSRLTQPFPLAREPAAPDRDPCAVPRWLASGALVALLSASFVVATAVALHRTPSSGPDDGATSLAGAVSHR